MIVFGRDVVERYFVARKGQHGIEAARRRYDAWLAEAEQAGWPNSGALKRQYGSASFVRDRVVFNISRNNYRLIVRVNYRAGVVEIRWFGTHAEYDRIGAGVV